MIAHTVLLSSSARILSCCGCCLLFFLLAAAAAAAVAAPAPAPPQEAGEGTCTNAGFALQGDGLTRVEELIWEPHKPFASLLRDRSVPLVLKQTAVDHWVARREWNLKYIVDAAKLQHHATGVLAGFFRQRGNPVFGPFYDPARPMHQLDGVKRINAYEENVALPLSEMIAKLSQPVGGSTTEFHMLSQNPSAISPALWADIEPMDNFILYPDRYSVNVWLGQPGATTPCHYDGYSNLYAHLQGAKRFYLLPSARWRETYTYPLLHPSYGQCQVNLTAPDQTTYRAAKPLREHPDALVADLQPGDLLYLPPFWLHEVVTLAPSVSVNFWSDTPQTKISEQVAQQPIPGLQIASFSGVVAANSAPLWPDDATKLTLPELAQPPARVILGAYVLLSTLGAAVGFDEQRLRQIVLDTATFRYGPLVGESGPLLNLQMHDHGEAAVLAVKATFCRRVHDFLRLARTTSSQSSGLAFLQQQLGADARLAEHLARYHDRVVPLLTDLAGDGHSADIWLANFVEVVAVRTLDLKHASVFIQALSLCMS